MLTVTMRDTSQEPRSVCDRICSSLRTRFLNYGYNGAWTAVLFKRVTDTTDTKISYLHQANKGKSGVYFVRTTDKGGWEVSVTPPSHISPGSVERREHYERNGAPLAKQSKVQEPQAPESESEEPDEEALTLNIGQMYQATVTDHLDHGLNLEVDAKTGEYHGYISLADLSPTYDVKELLKYPVGKKIRVIISEIDEAKRRITCSIRTEGIAGTTNKGDLFTGIPNKDGSLSLEGFTKDINRVYKVLEWFAILSADHYPNPIPHEVAMEWLIENLKTEYKVEVVEKRSASSVFASMCGGMEPLLNRIEEPRGYQITEFGWSEIGGKQKWLDPQTKEEPTELIPPLPSHITDIPPEPVKEPVKQEEETPQEGASIGDITTFLGKCIRRCTIHEQLSSLTREIQEIDKWLDDNKHLQEAAARLARQEQEWKRRN